MLERSNLGLFTLDPQLKILQMTWRLEMYFGMAREDVVGRNMEDLLCGPLQDILGTPDHFTKALLQTYKRNVYPTGLTCHVLPDDIRAERWLEYWSTPIRDGTHTGGRLECYLDVTGQQEAHQRVCKKGA